MGDKYLSDAIDYKRDIEPNFFVQTFASVGSGKPMNVCQKCGYRFKPGS